MQIIPRLVILGFAIFGGLSCAFVSSRTGLDLSGGDCILVPGTPWDHSTITVGLTEVVDPANAPGPANDSEQLLFDHLFETLLTVDCGGRIRPGLAESWESGPGGRVWTFTLRENARFSDGTKITGQDIRRAWNTGNLMDTGAWTWVHRDSIQSLDDTRIQVALSGESNRFPEIFAHPGLAIVKRESEKGWPVGTGPYLISLAQREAISCLPNPYHPGSDQTRSPLRFVVHPGMNPRDLLGNNVDVLLIRDKSAVEFASNLSEYTIQSLPWDRTYFVLSRYDFDEGVSREEEERVKVELAEEVVYSMGRPEERIGWPVALPSGGDDKLSTGGLLSIRQHSTSGTGSIVFCSMDNDAARITERFAALSRKDFENGGSGTFFGGGFGASALGLPHDELLNSIRMGGEWGYVFSVPRVLTDLRADLELQLMTLGFLDPRVPGLVSDIDCVPLISTRSNLVVRKGLVGLAGGGGGAVFLGRAGWERGADVP